MDAALAGDAGCADAYSRNSGLLLAMAEEKTYTQPTLNPHVKSIIEVDGYQFIDLNSNGTLAPTRTGDWMLTPARQTWSGR